MIRFLLALCVVCFASNAEARQRHRVVIADPSCNASYPNAPKCEGVISSPRGEYIAASGFGSAQKIYHPALTTIKKPSKIRHKSVVRIISIPAKLVTGIVAPLAAKVAEIQSVCGSQVTSGIRHTYIAGTRRISLHASGKAVDLAGNPSCIYSMLHGWAGGYSIDYASVRHVHLSYDLENGREMGARFVHGGHRKHYAHRRHRHARYARAG